MKIKSELLAPVAIGLISVAVFANALGGDFVYDDHQQIVQNPLIQDASLYGKALISDVWAYQSSGTVAASNYWRPTFVSWMILNFALFGLKPFGWHALNVLLHASVCILAYFLLRRWAFSPAASFAVSLIFAVHPAHTESVAWISGAPDMLFGLFLLAALWFTENFAKAKKLTDLVSGSAFYALALGAKEIGIFCFLLFPLVFLGRRVEEKSRARQSKRKLPVRFSRVFTWTLPFLALTLVYFLLRWRILGALSQPAEDAASFKSAILSGPSLFLFYVRQILVPFQLAANYPLRPVETIDFFHFGLPLIISICILVFAWLAARRCFPQRIGLALFVLPLLPVMNVSAFMQEQIVHDRYLYLPLLGFLMIAVPPFEKLIEKIAAPRRNLVIAATAITLSLPLALITWHYNPVWATDLALWRHTVRVDGNSAFNWSAYGLELSKQGKTADAIDACNRSLNIRWSPTVLMKHARSLIDAKEYDAAIRNLNTVIDLPDEEVHPYWLYLSYEALAIALVEQKKQDVAENRLLEARKRLPIYSAALTEKLAIVLYQANRKLDALRELESAKNQARAELLLESKRVFLRLGMLYAELGRKEEARLNLEEFLRLTINMREENIVQQRSQAEDLLRQLQ